MRGLFLHGIQFLLYAYFTRSSLAVCSHCKSCICPKHSYLRMKNPDRVTMVHTAFSFLTVALFVRDTTSQSIDALCGRCSTCRRKRLLWNRLSLLKRTGTATLAPMTHSYCPFRHVCGRDITCCARAGPIKLKAPVEYLGRPV